MERKPYYSLVDGFVDSVYRKIGDPLGNLTDEEAKYLVMAGIASATKPEVAKPVTKKVDV